MNNNLTIIFIDRYNFLELKNTFRLVCEEHYTRGTFLNVKRQTQTSFVQIKKIYITYVL